MTDKKLPPSNNDAASSSEPDNKPKDAGTTQGPSASISLTSSTNEKESNEVKKTDTSSATKAADKKTTSTAVDTKAAKQADKKTANTASVKPKQQDKKPSNAIAIFALFIALCVGAGLGGLYFWQQQAQQSLLAQLSQKTNQQLAANKQQVEQALSSQRLANEKAAQAFSAQIQSHYQDQIASLEQDIARLGQSKPSDWLLHEAEYLVRIAGRTLWLEKDTVAAISLLQDADSRLAELNNPAILPTRQLIYQDIEQLKLLPQLETEQVILQLMGMAKQINKLVLQEAHVIADEAVEEDLTLSEDAADWQDNLKKTLTNFSKQFLTISRREGNIEPLLLPQHQQNLRQNLQLKLQMAQWAAIQGEPVLYQSVLDDVTEWIVEFFDMELAINQNFTQNINTLKGATISADYPSSLSALEPIRALIKATPSEPFRPALPENVIEAQPKQEQEQEQEQEKIVQDEEVL